ASPSRPASSRPSERMARARDRARRTSGCLKSANILLREYAVGTSAIAHARASSFIVRSADGRCVAETGAMEELGLAMRSQRGDHLAEVAADDAIQFVER